MFDFIIIKNAWLYGVVDMGEAYWLCDMTNNICKFLSYVPEIWKFTS